MSVDKKTVRHIAKLARIALKDGQVEPMVNELNNIQEIFLKQIEQIVSDGDPLGVHSLQRQDSVFGKRLQVQIFKVETRKD